MKAKNKLNRQWMYCSRGLGLEFFADAMHCWHSNSLAHDWLGSQALYTQFNEGCFGNRSIAIDLFSVYASFSLIIFFFFVFLVFIMKVAGKLAFLSFHKLRVLSHDLYWEKQTYKLKRSITQCPKQTLLFSLRKQPFPLAPRRWRRFARRKRPQRRRASLEKRLFSKARWKFTNWI